MERKERIRAFIISNSNVQDETIEFSDEENFFAKGFVNSLFAMKLVSFLEREFDIEIDNDDLDVANFNSVQNILRFLDRGK